MPGLVRLTACISKLDTVYGQTYFGKQIQNTVDKWNLRQLEIPPPDFSAKDADGNPVILFL